MSNHRKVLWTLGVPMVGLVLALPFQHRADDSLADDQTDTEIDGSELALLGASHPGQIDLVIDTLVEAPPAATEETRGFNQLTERYQGSLHQESSPALQNPIDNSTPPPAIGNQYVPFFRRVSSEPPADMTQRLSEAERQRQAELERMDSFERPPSIEVLRYTIRDGDTLRGIAEKFLGDPNKSSEIFEANRNVLSNPQLLPLRTEIIVNRPVQD